MPTTVRNLFDSANLDVNGPVRFGDLPDCQSRGVYVVSDSPSPDVTEERQTEFDDGRLREWRNRCPEMKPQATGQRPTEADLKRVLSSWWLSDEPVLYVGRTTRSLQRRLRQYRETRIGKRRPHAGGFWVKALSLKLFVYWATSDDPRAAENEMLRAFEQGPSEQARSGLPDPEFVMPFANLEFPRGRRKPHGLSHQTC